MSHRLFGDDVLFYQRMLMACGYYTSTLDGDWGPITNRADETFAVEARRLRDEIGEFDPRTEAHISGLHIKAQGAARRFMVAANAGPHSCKILSGTRSYAEQNELFRQGRFGNSGRVVTNARGGYSNHNFGIAWDIGLFDTEGRYMTGATESDNRAYEEVATLVDLSELEWGGEWTTIVDRPHYQLRTGRGTTETRTLFEGGQAYA